MIVEPPGRRTPPRPPRRSRRRPPLVTRERLWILSLLLGGVVWIDLVRHRDPIGEKHFPLLAPGAADFSGIFDGTRVFLAGENPYCYHAPGFVDRWRVTATASVPARATACAARGAGCAATCPVPSR
jgi:hypothetical protein